MTPIPRPGRIFVLSAFASALVIASLVLAQTPPTMQGAPGKAFSPSGGASTPLTPKVLIPKPGGAAPLRLRPSAPTQPVAMAAPAVDAIVAKIQASKAGALGPSTPAAPPPLRLPFDIKPSALAGSGPQGAVHRAATVSTSFAQFIPELLPASDTYSEVDFWGIPDGAWFVDCSVDTGPGVGPYAVVSQISVYTSNSSTISSDTVASVPAQGPGHVALGVIFPPNGDRHDNSLFLRQSGRWVWYGCSFKPV
jgi:hypothetical protein